MVPKLQVWRPGFNTVRYINVRKRRYISIPVIKLYFWLTRNFHPETTCPFFSRFVFVWIFTFFFWFLPFSSHYSVQILLKVPKAAQKWSGIKQPLIIFFTFDIWSSTSLSTAVEQNKESRGQKMTSLFHRCLAFSIRHSHYLIFTSGTFYSRRKIFSLSGPPAVQQATLRFSQIHNYSMESWDIHTKRLLCVCVHVCVYNSWPFQLTSLFSGDRELYIIGDNLCLELTHST